MGVVAVDRTAIPKKVQEKLKTVSYDLASWEELGNAELPVGIVRIGQEGNVLHTLTGSLLRKETEFLWGQGEKETEVRMAITDGDSGSAVFDENGKLVMEKDFGLDYSSIEFLTNNEICIRNANVCDIYTVHGVYKFHHEFEEELFEIIPGKLKLNYTLVLKDTTQRIRLK